MPGWGRAGPGQAGCVEVAVGRHCTGNCPPDVCTPRFPLPDKQCVVWISLMAVLGSQPK